MFIWNILEDSHNLFFPIRLTFKIQLYGTPRITFIVMLNEFEYIRIHFRQVRIYCKGGKTKCG